MHITEAKDILNKRSGWKALSGPTDFGVTMKKAAQAGDEMAQLALAKWISLLTEWLGMWVHIGSDWEGILMNLSLLAGSERRESNSERLFVWRYHCLGTGIYKAKNIDGVRDSEEDFIEISGGNGVKMDK
jgi:acetate kinase